MTAQVYYSTEIGFNELKQRRPRSPTFGLPASGARLSHTPAGASRGASWGCGILSSSTLRRWSASAWLRGRPHRSGLHHPCGCGGRGWFSCPLALSVAALSKRFPEEAGGIYVVGRAAAIRRRGTAPLRLVATG